MNAEALHLIAYDVSELICKIRIKTLSDRRSYGDRCRILLAFGSFPAEKAFDLKREEGDLRQEGEHGRRQGGDGCMRQAFPVDIVFGSEAEPCRTVSHDQRRNAVFSGSHVSLACGTRHGEA